MYVITKDQKDIVRKAIAKSVSAYRKSIGLNQKQFAEKCCIAPSMVCNVEKALRVPELFTLIRLAKIMGTTIDEMIQFESIR